MKGLRVFSVNMVKSADVNGMVEKKVNALKLILRLDLKQLDKDN